MLAVLIPLPLALSLMAVAPLLILAHTAEEATASSGGRRPSLSTPEPARTASPAPAAEPDGPHCIGR